MVLSGCATLNRSGPSTAARPAVRPLYHDARQLTFAGRRTGEGYFSADGRELVFQSEREPGNPFYQIYRMDLETGETRRLSPGTGRATCAYFHPDAERVLFASSHEDPESELAQALELEKRESGSADRYSWDFDVRYDLFVAEPDGQLTALAPAEGYDAEGSFSPDGRQIVFASNRHAYHDALSPDDRDRLIEDPAYFVDLYRLELETGEITQLTSSPGYDGGPFFSPDGSRIVWRRFSEDGARAEILSMKIDGSDERALTRLGVMSWAPYFHPSGDYVAFATNRHGFDNFELYLVDAAGVQEPVRVTEHEGFDGLPVFSPSGDTLLWTSNRTEGKQSQLFRAKWDDAAAREALDLPARLQTPLQATEATSATPLATDPGPNTATAIENHVRTLSDPQTEGRGTGSAGETVAARHVESTLRTLGLVPAGDDGSYRNRFEYSAGIALGPENELHSEPPAANSEGSPPALVLDQDWRPLAFSKSGRIAPQSIVFVGYGIVAPSEHDLPAVDEYAGLDVTGRWVIVLRDLPESLSRERRQHLQRYVSLRHKSMIARDRGAAGILFVNGPRSRFREALAPLRFDAAMAGSGLAVAAVRDGVVDAWLATDGRSLSESQDRIDEAFVAGSSGEELRFELPGLRLAGRIDLETLRSESHNVIGRLAVGERPSRQQIVLGAHLDHLGRGEGSGSLADASELGAIHPGADDNASGVAVLLEIARALAARRAAGEDLGARDFVFAAWSGEELGLLGSDAWVDAEVNPHDHETGPVVYLNFDMVGRLEDGLLVHGTGSSPAWDEILERAALSSPLALAIRDDAYLPTDSTSFYSNGLPVLSAFTGVHAEYHTPRDGPELLNYEGAARIAELFTRIALALSRASDPPEFEAQSLPAGSPNRSGMRVYLGTIPDYSQTDVVGVRLSGVAPAGPAEAAGLRRGDTIVEVDGAAIANLYEFTFALEALRVGQEARIVVMRDGKRVPITVVPRSRD